MEYQIPIREVMIYQSEDGRKIERHKTILEEVIEIDDQNEIPDFNSNEIIYIGVASLPTNMGVQEVKFPIPADSIKDAFSKFVLYLKEVLEAANSQIVQASESDLNIIDSLGNNPDEDGPGIILS